MVAITADTITDAAIKALRDQATTTYVRFVASCALTGQNPYTAVGLDDNEWRECRAVVANLLNAGSSIVCTTCNDTHRMELRGDMVPCTRCPTPCQKCRANGVSAYCFMTPCGCTCHTTSSKSVAP